MKALGWALIIVGGGLVVLGARKVLASRNEEPEQVELSDWEQHLLDVEAQERNAHTSVHDLNDGV